MGAVCGKKGGGGALSGDPTPCKVTPVILHGVVSPETLHGVVSPDTRSQPTHRQPLSVGEGLENI